MYGLDPSTDVSALLGATLTHVGFGQFEVDMAFSGQPDCAATIEGHYRIAHAGSEPATFAEPISGSAAALTLLGLAVAGATVIGPGTLRVTFDDGSVLELLDSSDSYESYQLSLGDRLIVV